MLYALFYILFVSFTFQHELHCDMLSDCYLTDNGKAYDISINSFLLPNDIIKVTPKFIENNTDISLRPQMHLYGNSKHGKIYKSDTYECAGGLNECIDSCCLNGKCVKIFSLCKNKKNQIDMCYILTVSFFCIFCAFYFLIHLLIGIRYNESLTNKLVAPRGSQANQYITSSNVFSTATNPKMSEASPQNKIVEVSEDPNKERERDREYEEDEYEEREYESENDKSITPQNANSILSNEEVPKRHQSSFKKKSSKLLKKVTSTFKRTKSTDLEKGRFFSKLGSENKLRTPEQKHVLKKKNSQ